MLQRSTLISLFLALGLGSLAQPSWGQVVIPRTLKIDAKQLEETGLVLFKEAVFLSQVQRVEPALARAKLATQLAPNAPETWALLGGLYLNQKETDKGIAALQKSKSLDAKNPGVHFSLGAAYFSKGNYPQAAELLQAGLKIKPDVPEAIFDLGNTYYKMGSHANAITEYKKAVALNEKFWPAINNIGLVEYEKGNVKRAIKQWQSAIAIDEKSGEPQLALAVALYKQGNQAEAISQAQQALKIDGRYSKIDFLVENLWGDRLIADTKIIFATPQLKETISKIRIDPDAPEAEETSTDPEKP
ncbi:MAG: tetratricopeptide repeat protein [Acaryochloridaceae cyanobacterium SU_2_1]|nr:tetratricopeptide repeat protein [Acaryochloridaceae cyanobacterium SU_2_1]